MSRIKTKNIVAFILGMATFAIGYWILSNIVFPARPNREGVIDDWDQICIWQDQGNTFVSISPQGCYSTSCTNTISQIGTAFVDLQNQKIQLDAHFVLTRTSSFPFPCAKNCLGGNVQFEMDQLMPNDYEVWFRDDKVGEVKVFSGRPTPKQCFENN